MRRSFLQLLVLAPLPLIVLLILHSAERPLPAPASLHKNGSRGHASAMETLLPRRLPSGFIRVTRPQRFDKKTLFDRIDGAAPTYLAAGYRRSFGVEYKRKTDKDPVTVDLYDMGSAVQAFGLYAKESDPSYRFVAVGDGGYIAAGSLNFWSGKHYVKLAGFEEGPAMDRALQALAGDLIKRLGKRVGAAAVKAALAKLPARDRQENAAGYSRPPLLGVAGLEQAYFSRYGRGETVYTVFYIPAQSEKAAISRFDSVAHHLKKQAGSGVGEPTQRDGVTLLVARDRDRSKAMMLMRHRRAVFGAYDLPLTEVETVRETLVKQALRVGP